MRGNFMKINFCKYDWSLIQLFTPSFLKDSFDSDLVGCVIVACDFASIADHEISADQSGSVPTTFLPEDLEGGDFIELVGLGVDNAQLSGVTEHEQFFFGQEDATIAVFFASPLQFARFGVQAGERTFVESVNIAVFYDRAGKFRFQVL